MRYRAAAVMLALAAAVAIGQVPMYSDYPWGLLNNGVDQGPVWNLDCKPPLWCDVPTYGNGRVRLGDGGVLPIEVEFARFANDAGFAQGAGLAAFALDAGRAGFATFAADAGFADFAFDAGRSFLSSFSDYAADAGSAGFAAWAGDAGFAVGSGLAQYALDAGLASKAFAADFARDAGSAASADLATASLWAGDAGFAVGSGLAQYALDAGLASKAFAADFARDAGSAANADFARDAGSAASADLATAALWAGDAGFSINAGQSALATYALDAGLANKAFAADFARDAGSAANADFARDAGSAASADISTFALDAGRATFATFAADAGLSVAALFAADAGNLQCTTCVDAADIATAAVTTPKLAALSVTAAKLDDGPSLSAYDEATVVGVHSRSTATNCTKGSYDGSTAYIRFTVNTVVTNPQVSTTLYTGTSTNARTPTAVMRYRLSGGFTSAPPSVIRAINNANTAQTADAPGVVADGNWHTATFDISGWTTVGTLRVDLLMPSTLATAGNWDISYLGTGIVGSGTDALVSYRGGVGVGTAIPLSKLSVTGASAAEVGDGITGIAQFTTGTGINTDEKLQLGVVDGSYSWIQAIKPGTAYRNLVLQPSGGNVGIGSTPSYRLHVQGGALGVSNGTWTTNGNDIFLNTNGSSAIYLRPGGAGSTNWQYEASGSSAYHRWLGASGAELARLTGTGLGVGGTASVRLHTFAVNENLRMEGTDPWASFYQSGTRKGWWGYGSAAGTADWSFVNQVAAGDFVWDTNGGAYTFYDFAGGGTTGASINNNGDLIRTPSDERLKENISDLPRGLDAVLRMRPVRFQWRDKKAYGDRWDVGFIAQEMISSVPEAVSRNPDGMYSLDYGKLIAVVVGAIQELFDDRTWLARRVQELEDRAQRAEDKLAQLEARLLSLENYSGIKGCGNCPQTDDGENPP